jgi:hypothetical protein
VGYYLSVFLWAMAFILTDLLHAPGAEVVDESAVHVLDSRFEQWPLGQISRTALQ